MNASSPQSSRPFCAQIHHDFMATGGLEAAGLALGVVAATDLCFK